MIRRAGSAGPLAVATLLALLVVPATPGEGVPLAGDRPAPPAVGSVPLGKPVADTTASAPSDSTARPAVVAARADSTRARALPERTLTLRQQVMFAGGFMAFIALMMASMQNFNP